MKNKARMDECEGNRTCREGAERSENRTIQITYDWMLLLDMRA